MTTGQRIRDERTRAGLSQAELATRIGVTPLTIRNYEFDRTSPTVDRLSEIALALGTSVSRLHPDLVPSPSAA